MFSLFVLAKQDDFHFCICEGDVCKSVCDDIPIIYGPQIDEQLSYLSESDSAILEIYGSAENLQQCTHLVFQPGQITFQALGDSIEMLRIDCTDLDPDLIQEKNITMRSVQLVMFVTDATMNTETGGSHRGSQFGQIFHDEISSILLKFNIVNISNGQFIPDKVYFRIIAAVFECAQSDYVEIAEFITDGGRPYLIKLSSDSSVVSFDGYGLYCDDILLQFRPWCTVDIYPSQHDLVFQQKQTLRFEVLFYFTQPTTIIFESSVIDLTELSLMHFGHQLTLMSHDGVSPVPEVEVRPEYDVEYIPPRPEYRSVCMAHHYDLDVCTGMPYETSVSFQDSENLTKYINPSFDSVTVYLHSGSPSFNLQLVKNKTITIKARPMDSHLVGLFNTVHLNFPDNDTTLDVHLSYIDFFYYREHFVGFKSLTMFVVTGYITRAICTETFTSDIISLPDSVVSPVSKVADNGLLKEIGISNTKVTINSKREIESDNVTIESNTTDQVIITYDNSDDTSMKSTYNVVLLADHGYLYIDTSFGSITPVDAAKITIDYVSKLTIDTALEELPAFTIVEGEGREPPIIHVTTSEPTPPIISTSPSPGPTSPFPEPTPHKSTSNSIILAVTVPCILLVTGCIVALVLFRRKPKSVGTISNGLVDIEQ